MARNTVPIAMAGLFMGAAVIPPVLLDAVERGGLSSIGLAFAAVGCVMVVCGSVTFVTRPRQRPVTSMPSGVRLTVAANVLFLSFFSLEFSDLMVRQGGKLFYWTNFLFLPAMVLFWGLLKTRRWAWWMSRGIAAFGVLWFVGFSFLIPFGNIRKDGVPIDWVARLYMIGVSLVFASVLVCAFRAIGRPDTRSYFGLTPHRD